ncbi:unnamed protein product [Sphenostylis stenocarpa]|uniref:Uncharacterized protein n=1 Tax=Sphenostylis stenocarpa TaxID=92480 RepID=A0AA86SRL6_9FABA|nr:unnamed protein product [Sphenostylis stenocarpa]
MRVRVVDLNGCNGSAHEAPVRSGAWNSKEAATCYVLSWPYKSMKTWGQHITYYGHVVGILLISAKRHQKGIRKILFAWVEEKNSTECTIAEAV